MQLVGITIRVGCFAAGLSVGMACHAASGADQQPAPELSNPAAMYLIPLDEGLDAVVTSDAATSNVSAAPLQIPSSMIPVETCADANERAAGENSIPHSKGQKASEPSLLTQVPPPPAPQGGIQQVDQLDVADEVSQVLSPPGWPAVDLAIAWAQPIKPRSTAHAEYEHLLDVTWSVQCPSTVLPVANQVADDPSRELKSMLASGTVVPNHLHRVPDQLVHAKSIQAGTQQPTPQGVASRDSAAPAATSDSGVRFVVDHLKNPSAIAASVVCPRATNNSQQPSTRLVANTTVVAQPEPIAAGVESVPSMMHPCPPATTLGPYSPCPVHGFHCVGCPKCAGRGLETRFDWKDAGPIPWEAFGHGEYIGPARTADVPVYRLRVDDLLDFVFRLTRDVSKTPYQLEVGDRVLVESLTSPTVNREVIIQSDGTITLRDLGQVPAAGRTIEELRKVLDEAYSKFITDPQISVVPIETNTKQTEMIAAVDSRFGRGGQQRLARVTPEGTIQLPAIGSVPAQGLTLDELQREIHARYSQIVKGLEVTPILQERAPRYVFVVGEVLTPGRYTLEGPTTVMQSIALAEGWNIGADLRHVIVFRRDNNWNLMATRLNLRPPLYGRSPCPADEIWLRDSDIVLVPKHPILAADDAIELIFTRGIYSVFPISWNYQFQNFTTVP